MLRRECSSAALALLLAFLVGCASGGGETRFRLAHTIEVGAAPHGICFDESGVAAFVAVSGDGEIARIDTRTYEITERLEGGAVPLDVAPMASGDSLMVTQFRHSTLIRVPLDGGGTSRLLETGRGPSLFSRPGKQGVRYVVSEFADVVIEVDPHGRERRRWATGDRPYPAGLTSDGILLFVPNRDDGTVTVIDTLNDAVVATVEVGGKPQGGAVTADDTEYAVACSDEEKGDAIRFINTASFEVVGEATEGIGPGPFAVARTPDERLMIVNNSGGDTISVLDAAQRRVIDTITVGEQPIVVRTHPDGSRMFVSNEVSGTVSVIGVKLPKPTTSTAKTEVIVLGMVHSDHLTSEFYGLDVVTQLVRAIDPDDICVEIPPNRWRAAKAQLDAGEEVTEPRTRVFAEYMQSIFPLYGEMRFTIVPTAGWTHEMNLYRRNAMNAIRADPSRAAQWAEHEAAFAEMERTIAGLRPENDPRIIHSDAYDDAIRAGFGGPYNRYFNDELSDGGWDNINAKHYGHVADHLDRVRGQGRRVLVTYGAAHKSWFLDRLRERDDVTLLDVNTFLDEIGR